MVKELLKHNANIEEKDNSGWTPLIWAIFLNYSIIFLMIHLFFIYTLSNQIKLKFF